MNLPDIKINFDELFKERIKSCGVYEMWQKPHVRDIMRYFWYELENTGKDPWLIVFNPCDLDKDAIFKIEFHGEDIEGNFRQYDGENWIDIPFKENSHCIVEENLEICSEKFNMSKWWDNCVCDYLRRINVLQHTQKKFNKLNLKEPKFVKKLHKEIRNVYNI